MSEQDFEWDETKNKENQRKHGVTFYEAQYAFLDTNRIIGAGYWRKGKKIYEQNNSI